MPISTEILVSVIMTNHNYGKFLKQAIDSVLTQSYDNFELIIVDDGSTDDSTEIIKSYADHRIKCILKTNSGQASAFNSGFNIAKGEYIAYLDSDDLWHKEKLTSSMKIFEQYPNISLVQHPLEIIDENAVLTGMIHPPVNYSGKHNLLKYYYIEKHTNFFSPTSGLTIPKHILDKIFPLNASWKICADVLLTRPLPLFGDVFCIFEPLGLYRIHDHNNWMNTDTQACIFENNIKYVEYTNQWLRKFGYNKQIDYLDSAHHTRWLRNSHNKSQINWYWLTATLNLRKLASRVKRLYF